MEQHVGVISASGDRGLWAVGAQVNGYIGVTEELVVPLSAGTAVVSHYQNSNAVDQFYWVEDRIFRLDFEPVLLERKVPDEDAADRIAGGVERGT